MERIAFKPLLLAAGLLACMPMAQAATTLVYCSEASPAGFDPSQYTSGTDFDASAETVFNRLTQFKRGGTDIEPGLATKWDVSNDGLQYTFHLRQGVKFHTTEYFTPTRDFNADDVLFTFNRMLDAEHPFRKAYPTEFPYFNGMSLNKNIAKVEKTGPLTVAFTLNSVDAAFIQNIAMSFAAILSAEYADKLLAAGKTEAMVAAAIGQAHLQARRPSAKPLPAQTVEALQAMIEAANAVAPGYRTPSPAPRWLLLALAWMQERWATLSGRPAQLLTSQVRLFHQVRQEYSIAKAQRELGYQPRPPEQALQETFKQLLNPA
mgnify:CR=1 FL=1